MKTMDFLTLLGELDEVAAAPVDKRKKRRSLWVAAAACFCACLLGFSAWFFLPPVYATTNELILTTIRVENRLACYRVVDTEQMSRFERLLLPDDPGEILCTHGSTTFYRVKGANDLVYLLGEKDGRYTLYEFEDFTSLIGVDMRDSYWYESGWLTDEDIAAFDCETKPTMGEILERIYGAASFKDIKSIRFEKDGASGGSVGKRIRVKAVTVKDNGALERLYGLLASMTPADYGQAMDFGSVHVHDEAYLKGEQPLSDQVNRDLTITLTSGHRVTVTYYPNVGLLHQGGMDLYTVLSEADNAWLIDLAAIDMEWRDWGTEKALVYGEDCETAVAPPIPEAEQPEE